MAMENCPFIDDFPSYKPPFIYGIFHGYASHNQMVSPVILLKVFSPRNPLEARVRIPRRVLHNFLQLWTKTLKVYFWSTRAIWNTIAAGFLEPLLYYSYLGL